MDRPSKFYACAICFVIAVTLCVRSYWQEEGFALRNGSAYAGIATHRGGIYCYWFSDRSASPLLAMREGVRFFSQSIVKDYGTDVPESNALGFTNQRSAGVRPGKIVSMPFWFPLLITGLGLVLWRRKRFKAALSQPSLLAGQSRSRCIAKRSISGFSGWHRAAQHPVRVVSARVKTEQVGADSSRGDIASCRHRPSWMHGYRIYRQGQ